MHKEFHEGRVFSSLLHKCLALFCFPASLETFLILLCADQLDLLPLLHSDAYAAGSSRTNEALKPAAPITTGLTLLPRREARAMRKVRSTICRRLDRELQVEHDVC